MKPQRDITVDDFYGALEEGVRREAERKKYVPSDREARGPFSEEKYYKVISMKTGELCFASRIRPSGWETGEEALYQVVRCNDKKTRWLGASDFVTQFKRLEGKPEPLRLDWIGSDYKKIAIDDNEDGTVLQAAFDRMRQRRMEIA
ncbi:hypothetical protein QMM44_00985 [Leptospira santarosai]|uniref:hypothetical protein n=1 Tax=Leptospira santarosai TaxID=28183 RepID=UPI0024AFA042|nr:hypothetical protein [Leptospira santarosai]MDI7202025.1 hypothetical protein [Leptospira santarosai]